MNSRTPVTRVFSGALWRQDMRENTVLVLAILVIMVLICIVLNFAASIVGTGNDQADTTGDRDEFFACLGILAAYDEMTGSDLSYADFATGARTDAYDQAFAAASALGGTEAAGHDVASFSKAIDGLLDAGQPVDAYVRQFEYAYALAREQGVFTGRELTVDDLVTTTLELAGLDASVLEAMESADTSSLINTMYYTGTGILAVLLLMVLMANNLIAAKVDRGTMAYVLSTPVTRPGVATTQVLFMLAVPLAVLAIVCAVRIATTQAFYGEVNAAGIAALFAGMYVLVEAVGGICFFGSCLFNRSTTSLAFGGGLTLWFFLASLLGIFGSQNMVDLGVGVEELAVFNHLTLVGLYNIDALATVGTASIDWSFAGGLVILAVIALVGYAAGAVVFRKKDLPL